MTSRFEDLLDISSAVMPYLHYPERPALKETTCSTHDAIIKTQMTFYGFELPAKNDALHNYVYDLFHQDYASLEMRLHNGDDRHINYPYASKDAEGKWQSSSYRSVLYNAQWNKFTLMELVYMQGDFIAYQLLKKYKRTTAYYIGDWNIEYLNDAATLLITCNELSKHKKLMNARINKS